MTRYDTMATKQCDKNTSPLYFILNMYIASLNDDLALHQKNREVGKFQLFKEEYIIFFIILQFSS